MHTCPNIRRPLTVFGLAALLVITLLLSTAVAEGRARRQPQRGEQGENARSVAEVNALIDRVGRTPPDWYDDTPLNYPETLDLSWPHPPPGGWNNQRNVGQYVWDIINPNENKWREGVKLMHHLIQVNQRDEEVRTRAMDALGLMYYSLHQDYARAAFWWRVAQRSDHHNRQHDAMLAHCYYKLGNKQMAMRALDDAQPSWHMIKVLSDMGEVEAAVNLADRFSQSDRGLAALMAGDVLRKAGEYDEAARLYEEAIEATRDDDDRRHFNRATAQLEAIRLYDALDLADVPDGTHTDRSRAYEGDLEVAVTVRNGRIEDVRITHHTEKQFYGALEETPSQIIDKQSVTGIETTARATITSEAIINAAAKALSTAADD